jgi:hypothetical protein
MTMDRFLKITAWLYIAALVAVTFAHIDWQAEIGNPFNMYRVVILGIGGLLARLAYPLAPTLACLMVIGGVCGLGVAHALVNGNYGYPIDTIADMAGGLWGVALGSVLRPLLFSSTTKRTALN